MSSEADVLADLRAVCQARGAQSAFAEKLGVSRSLVSQMVRGKKPVTEAAANALGYVLVYRKIGAHNNG